tara:strand:- start:775 stop:984 length:210 start_codon:yes stop_codon:yes gene_type:complete
MSRTFKDEKGQNAPKGFRKFVQKQRRAKESQILKNLNFDQIDGEVMEEEIEEIDSKFSPLKKTNDWEYF